MNARRFRLPDLGEGLTEAEVLRWLVGVGDSVAVDQPVVEVETAKASVEVPSPYAGVVAELHAAEGGTVEVGAPLISIAPAVPVPTAGEGSGNVLVGYGTAQARRRERRARRPAPAAPVNGTASRPLVISPIVRRLARDHHVDLTALTGTAPGGVIARRDVERAIAAAGAPVAAGPSVPAAAGPSVPAAAGAGATAVAGVSATAAAEVSVPAAGGGLPPVGERVSLRGVRRSVADRLTRSRQEIPDATTWVDVDATDLVETRRRTLARDPEHPVGILAFVARFVVAGLARYPDLNSRVDVAAGEIVRFAGVNLGIAAQGERGLVVPVVHDAHRCNVRELHARIARLATDARTGALGVADLTGGTFTLNNYGVFNVDGATPIINHPEAALLGMGRILDRPWVVDGEVVPRKIAQLSLTFDHRVCDGGTAAGFLRFVVDCVEHPAEALALI
ncbi:dihydrolipoamide acetyltransferase family protein [Phytohabitans suffuscus]|uniref:Dihydrolipoamide acetyltransferase component of pyruvate dehydrogenase complex n=1 Tax=Phytohabitans suffuscus TaxID=624315 RepID=A0A6F8YXI3_9ACTN|nr:dihydrolipoamide acetyltransferase family protein [Phytohabitans suffuscus]BCB90713.1 dihydrolipoamide acetyltransferase component of pyruvate dehydrogenase complex [Phytohabitans suffuscus]